MAHTSLSSTLIKAIDNTPSEVAGVGAVHKPAQDETFFGKVMTEVQSSLLGGLGVVPASGNAYVDSVTFTLYKKHLLEQIALQDVRFDVGQDMELNWRIKKAGFKLMISHDSAVY